MPASLQRMLPQGAARCSGTRTCVVLSRPPRCWRVLGPHQKTIVSSMEPMHCTMLALMSCPTLSSSRFLASILPAAHTKQQHTKRLSGKFTGPGWLVARCVPRPTMALKALVGRQLSCLQRSCRSKQRGCPSCTQRKQPVERGRHVLHPGHSPALATTRRSSGMFSSSTTALSYLPAAVEGRW